MNRVFRGGMAAVLVAAAFSPLAQGAGFGLYEGSARGNALGGTLTGRADDPSAIFYNPAGITQLPGDQFMVGVTFIRPQTDVTTLTPAGKVTTSTEKNWWYPPHAYYTHGFNDKLWAGLGLYSRFGLGTEFPSTWPGRYNSYDARIQSLTLNPNLAYKLTDKLSVAAGFDAVWFDMQLKRMALVHGADVPVEMKGDAWGYGFNLAARYALTESVAIGATYISKVKEDISGTATAGSASTGASGGVELPQEGTVALMFKPADKLSVEVGVTVTGWKSYDSLNVKFDNPAILGPEINSAKNWSNAFRYQAGVEYEATRACVLRAGYVYDEEPIPLQTADYLVPGNDRHLLSAGFGYRWQSWVLDVSYTYLMITDRHIPARLAEGVFESDFSNGNAHMLGVSVSTKL
jgi:long-chain fatty acid transport protein